MANAGSESRIKVEFHLDELDKAANERVSKLIEKAVSEELAKRPTRESVREKILLGIRSDEPPTTF